MQRLFKLVGGGGGWGGGGAGETHKNRWEKTHNNNKNEMRVSMTVEFAYVLYTTNRLSRSIDYCELNVLLLFAAV